MYPKRVELNRDELRYFVSLVLLDEASRSVAGKRNSAPMNGFWISRTNPVGMRLSDAAFRRAVCIEELRRVGGFSISKAAAYVASVLGLKTARHVHQVRVAYYKYRPHDLRNSFYGQFLTWREWLLKSADHSLQSTLDRFSCDFGKPRRQRLEKLFEDVRRDPAQHARHRFWIAERALSARVRIETGRWDPEPDWQLLATDHWALGRYSIELGELPPAKSAVESAVAIWRTQGHTLARIQAKAIPELEPELARFGP